MDEMRNYYYIVSLIFPSLFSMNVFEDRLLMIDSLEGLKAYDAIDALLYEEINKVVLLNK